MVVDVLSLLSNHSLLSCRFNSVHVLLINITCHRKIPENVIQNYTVKLTNTELRHGRWCIWMVSIILKESRPGHKISKTRISFFSL